MRAYKESYLNDAAKNFGNMLDFAVNDCGLNGGLFLNMFVISGYAKQFERGAPRIVSGMSGIELAAQVIKTVTGAESAFELTPRMSYSKEYWAGWALALYQWHTALNFSDILRFLSFEDVINMYPTLHEADITKFYSTADEIRARKKTQTNLKRIRESAGLTQSQLSEQADVSLRSIQMYEQRNKDINKAQSITLAKISRVLGCDIEDLLE